MNKLYFLYFFIAAVERRGGISFHNRYEYIYYNFFYLSTNFFIFKHVFPLLRGEKNVLN